VDEFLNGSGNMRFKFFLVVKRFGFVKLGVKIIEAQNDVSGFALDYSMKCGSVGKYL
jgi:predicted HAD superfamily hydrolase